MNPMPNSGVDKLAASPVENVAAAGLACKTADQ